MDPFRWLEGKKRLCHKSKACYFARPVPIFAWIDKHFAYESCELADRDWIRTGTKNTIMVKALLKQKQEIDADGDEPVQDLEKPNWNAMDDQEQGTPECNKD